tara:strand:- start:435 stop:584 length:150 start_codon:yes stop_codon:yes gene_type:complete
MKYKIEKLVRQFRMWRIAMGVKFLLWNTERRLKKIAKKQEKTKLKQEKA